jgi:uncharacterized protein (DUF2141 family)
VANSVLRFIPFMNLRLMLRFPENTHRFLVSLLSLLLAAGCAACAQNCYTGTEIDTPSAKALGAAAQRYFEMSAKGDVAGLRTNAIPEVSANFGGIERAVVANKQFFAAGEPESTRTFILDASEAKTSLQRADFFCGIYNSSDRIVFSIPNLPPGRYAVTIAKVTTADPITLTMILQDTGTNSWKLAGYYARRNSIGGHDGPWFLAKAREYKEKGQLHNAWFYYLTAWDLIAPVDFMGTPQLDKLSDEVQASRPADLPGASAPLELAASGKNFKVSDLVALPIAGVLDLRVQYQNANAANATQASLDNAVVIKATVVKYPELREAFNAVIARAVDDSGRAYETLTPTKDIK